MQTDDVQPAESDEQEQEEQRPDFVQMNTGEFLMEIEPPVYNLNSLQPEKEFPAFDQLASDDLEEDEGEFYSMSGGSGEADDEANLNTF